MIVGTSNPISSLNTGIPGWDGMGRPRERVKIRSPSPFAVGKGATLGMLVSPETNSIFGVFTERSGNGCR